MKKMIFLILSAFAAAGVQAQTLADAQAAIEAEKFDQARVILQKLVNDNPDDGQFEFHLGNLYLTLGEDALAKASFERGVTAKKNGQLNYIGLGRILLDDGKPQEAAAEFEKAMYKMKKKDTDKYLYIAKAYFESFNPDYQKSAEYARKVVTITPAKGQGHLALGDAEYKLDNLNEAYKAYRNAYTYNNKLLRGKLNLAVITKESHAFPEAVQTLNEIISLDPSYGPTYRELAEVYYMWASMDASVYDEYIAKALDYYEKYMQLTDYSLVSRMRHADFLVLAKDYQALEKEAAEMQKIDNVNPRILRYLGYSAFENENYEEAAQALVNFLNAIDARRALGIDYSYLARAQVKLLEEKGVENMDVAEMRDMLSVLAKAIEKEEPIENEFADFGRKLYSSGQYGYASEVFGELIKMQNPLLLYKLYYANAIFYNAAKMDEAAQAAYMPEIMKADEVYGSIIEASPKAADAYFNRARLNRFIPNTEEKSAELFQQYIDVVMTPDAEIDEAEAKAKVETELAKPVTRRKLSEAFTSVGVFYSDTDPAKAISYFEQALTFDPEYEHAALSLKFLKQ